jgi:cell pole-organizing protein PopZ
VPAAKAEIDAFRAELRPIPEVAAERRPPAAPISEAAFTSARDSEPAQVTELPSKAFRLAEVQAQVAREAAAQPKAPEPEKPPITLAEVQQQLAKETSAPPATAAVSIALAPGIPAAPSAPSRKPDQTTASAVEATPERPREPLDLRYDEQLAGAKVAQAPVVDTAPKPAIISPSAGRQVAAAFGELSEAFAARSKKTFDDLAEEMLRPMLQDWLDNNLPILVERLVREEIERVARGVE